MQVQRYKQNYETKNKNTKIFHTFAHMKSAFIIAAPTSGSGKTTLSTSLMALFKSKGYSVQPFKCGPDYIDTKFHQYACGRPSINLDSFMASPDHIRELYASYAANADICIVEGMMGLFDGYDRDKGSSAEIASILQLPVVLVVDAKSAAYSTAALLSGFLHFRQDLKIAGVIYNKVGSQKHADMLRQVSEDLHITCFGYLPKNSALEQDSRYLGLDFSRLTDSCLFTKMMAEHLDIEVLLTHTSVLPTLSVHQSPSAHVQQDISVLIARNNDSFSFLYQENLDRYKKVSFFDPEHDVPALQDIDLLYLPGGYPEKHLEALAENEACRQAIKAFAEQDGKIIAECGGMMYLCQQIIKDEGTFPMCGVLPYSITARKANCKLSLGYRQFTLNGKEYRGHEFHYTTFLGEKPQSAVQVYNAKGVPVDTPVFKYKNVLASYTHLYHL